MVAAVFARGRSAERALKRRRTANRFIPSLESVRGLAALTVCLFHAADIQYLDRPILNNDAFLRLILNGHGAVILFFVLSGFVLRLSLEKKRSTPLLALSFRFVMARIFRLYPVVIATVIVFASVAFFLGVEQILIAKITKNALLLDTTINGAFWTLQVELFGSALVLVAFLLERRFGLLSVVVLTMALLPLSFVGSRGHIGGAVHVGYLYPFLCGYLVATWPRQSARSFWYPALALSAGLIAFYGAHANGYVLKQGLLLVTTIGASLIVFALSRPGYENSLGWSPIASLGRLSYSFYALHPLGIDFAVRLTSPIEKLSPPHWIVAALLMSLAVVMTLLLSIPMNYFIERPGLAIGRRLVEASVPRNAVPT